MGLILDILFELLIKLSKNWNTASGLFSTTTVAGIAGVIGGIVMLRATNYFLSYEDVGRDFTFYFLMISCLVGGAVAGGLVAGIREKNYGFKPIIKGGIARVIGAAISPIVAYTLVIAMM